MGSFAWNIQAQSAFEELKQAMVTTLVLALSNSNTTYTAEANACSTRMGTVLSWGGKPITFFSKASSPKHQALSVYEKEMLTILAAVKRWNSTLMDRHFRIKTDTEVLNSFCTKRLKLLLNKCG